MPQVAERVRDLLWRPEVVVQQLRNNAAPHLCRLSFQGLLTHGQLLNELRAQVVAAARLVGDRNRSLPRYLDFRLDNVFFPVTLRSRNVTRQLEIGQSR